MLSKYLPPYQSLYEKNETELFVKIKPTNCYFAIKGADKPDSLRGANPYGIIFDEYELIDPVVWEEIIMPIILAKNDGFVWFLGTPKPTGAHFKNLIENTADDKDWAHFNLTAEESGILTLEQIAYAKRVMTDRAYRQEYLCEWLTDEGAVFRKIDEAATSYQREPQSGHDYVIGCDLGKYEDYTVLSAVDLMTHEQVAIDRFQDQSWALQEARIAGLAYKYNKALVRIEVNSAGDPIAESLRRKGVRIEPFLTTSKSKSDLIDNAVLLFEQGKVKILPDNDQMAELKIFGYEITRSRNIVYGAPEGKHDDCVIALCLSLWGLKDKKTISNLGAGTAYRADTF